MAMKIVGVEHAEGTSSILVRTAILISYIVAWFTKDERVKSPVRLLTQLEGVLIIFGEI